VLSINFSVMIILCGQLDLHHVEHGILIPCTLAMIVEITSVETDFSHKFIVRMGKVIRDT
jgi:hypothetical protein